MTMLQFLFAIAAAAAWVAAMPASLAIPIARAANQSWFTNIGVAPDSIPRVPYAKAVP